MDARDTFMWRRLVFQLNFSSSTDTRLVEKNSRLHRLVQQPVSLLSSPKALPVPYHQRNIQINHTISDFDNKLNAQHKSKEKIVSYKTRTTVNKEGNGIKRHNLVE